MNLESLCKLIISQRFPYLLLVVPGEPGADNSIKELSIQSKINNDKALFICEIPLKLFNEYEALIPQYNHFVDMEYTDKGILNLLANRTVCHNYLASIKQ